MDGSLSALALVLLIIGLLVPILTAGHILGRIAHLGDIVVDLSQLAAQIAGILTVQADIELLAICGMRVPGMGDHLTTHIGLGLVLGAGEAALGFLCAKETETTTNTVRRGQLAKMLAQAKTTHSLDHRSPHAWPYLARRRCRSTHRNAVQRCTSSPAHLHRCSCRRCCRCWLRDAQRNRSCVGSTWSTWAPL